MLSGRLVKPYGRINIGGLLWLAVLAAIVYAAVMFSPLYLDNLDVKGAAARAVAQANKLTDVAIQQYIVNQTERVGTHFVEGEDGRLEERQGLGLAPEDILVERDPNGAYITVQVRYQRRVELKPFNRFSTVDFTVEKDGPIR